MKKELIFFSFLIVFCSIGHSQLPFGLRGGFHTSNIGKSFSILDQNGQPSINFDRTSLNWGFHFGPALKLDILNIDLEFGPSFNFSRTNIDQLNSNFETFTKDITSIDIPIIAAIDLLFFDLNFGINGHYYLNLPKQKNVTLGFLGGLGLDFNNLGLDLNFELNPNTVSYVIDISGIPYTIEENKHQIYLTLTWFK